MIGFGTDGIRGKAAQLNEEVAYRVGLALASFFNGGSFLVGRDSRISGEALADALICGICGGGGQCEEVGVVPTPCVAMLTKLLNKSCGVMVTASHNPPEYNGIKVFSGTGLKLTRKEELQIENYMLSAKPCGREIKRGKLTAGEDIYISELIKKVSRLDGVKVTLDCAHGSACGIAKKAFVSAGASVSVCNNIADGRRINVNCGALNPKMIKKSKLGFAFDGDADRVVAAVNGQIIDGDSILYTLSKKVELKDGVVVGTVMSNFALERALKSDGKRLIRTDVGDKHISAIMNSSGYTLGGEQSGHYIINPFLSGDGIFTALKLSEILKDDKIHILDAIPQKSLALYANKDVTQNDVVKKLIDYYSLKGVRLVVRMSGTEQKVRIMAESENSALVDRALKDFSAVIGGLK